MSEYTSFDPTKVVVMIGTHRARGFADGDMIDVGYSEPLNTQYVGTDGSGRHIASANKSGDITIRLMQSSPTNAVLSALIAANEPIPIAVADKTSTADLFFTSSAKCNDFPRMKKGKEETVLEYKLGFVRGFILHTGSKEI